MSPPGRFLEISVHAPEVAESLAFYERLGLAQAPAGDIWSHAYGVVTDGRVAIGLHDFEFPSPALTWVRPGLAAHARELAAEGRVIEFAKTGDEEFHELGFLDPDGQMLTLLEARTFSPLERDPGRLECGYFREYRRAVARLRPAVDFWESLGFVAIEVVEDGLPRAALTGDGLNLCLYEAGRPGSPQLVFSVPDAVAAAAAWARRRLVPEPVDDPVSGERGLALEAPEGTRILVLPEDE